MQTKVTDPLLSGMSAACKMVVDSPGPTGSPVQDGRRVIDKGGLLSLLKAWPYQDHIWKLRSLTAVLVL